jgi:hypothetical protein
MHIQTIIYLFAFAFYSSCFCNHNHTNLNIFDIPLNTLVDFTKVIFNKKYVMALKITNIMASKIISK